MNNENLSQDEAKDYIQLSLLHLGVMRWNKSSKRLRSALEYVIIDNAMGKMPVGAIYDHLASVEGSSYAAIERSLRYIIGELWECDPKNCSRLFYRTSEIMPCPCVSEFLRLFVFAFQNGIIEIWVKSFDKSNMSFEDFEKKEIQMILDKLSMIKFPLEEYAD